MKNFLEPPDFARNILADVINSGERREMVQTLVKVALSQRIVYPLVNASPGASLALSSIIVKFFCTSNCV